MPLGPHDPGIYPTDAKACYTVDSLAGGIEDFIGKFIKAHPNFGGSKVRREHATLRFPTPSRAPPVFGLYRKR